MEHIVLGVFCAGLLLCVVLSIPILYSLGFGLLLFLFYGRRKGFSWRELAGMTFSGIKTARNILVSLFLIGIMTALWRAAGTIPYIVSRTAGWMRPAAFLLMVFLLNSGLSFLTGTSFGTSATMGVICASMGAVMQVSPLLTGGAVLSGVFFGDRCSPVSSSALLVAGVTQTDIYDNIRRMVRTALVPFLLTCLVYSLIGLLLPRNGAVMDLESLFSGAFRLNWITLLPAAAVLLLSVFRINVKLAMGASILVSVPICLFVQGIPFPQILQSALTGFFPENQEVAAMISGGGITSMLNVAGIVCISSAYAGIFRKTGLLDGAKHAVMKISEKTSPFAATLLTSSVSGMIACSQTLTILLTHQLCGSLYADPGLEATDIEDTAVVISPLIPWSIAGSAPLAAIGAPASAILASFYLIFIPSYRLALSLLEKRRLKDTRHQ